MVAELSERVKLEKIKKDASLEPPLTAKGFQKKKTKLSEESKARICQFIDDLYSSHRGFCDTPAAIYALKEKFGTDEINENYDFIEVQINEAKDKHKSPGVSQILTSPYQGQPIKADPQSDMFQPLFENIKRL